MREFNQFQLHPPTHPPGILEFARLVSPRGGTIANFEQPFDLAFAKPGKAFEMHVVSYHKNN